jgi:hypothetical protein
MPFDETPSASGVLLGNFCAEVVMPVKRKNKTIASIDLNEVILFWFRMRGDCKAILKLANYVLIEPGSFIIKAVYFV